MNEKISLAEAAINAITKDCQYTYVNYDTIEDNKSYDEYGYCRSSDIVSLDITCISYNSIVSDVLKTFGLSDNDCLRYLLQQYTKNNISNDDFEFSQSNGYYGAELDWIRLERPVAEKIVNFCIKNMDQEYGDLVKNALVLEHGFLSKSHQNISITKTNITYKDLVSKIKITNTNPNVSTIQKILSSKDFGRIILEKENEFYKIIDGNHRFQALLNELANISYYDIEVFSQDDLKTFREKWLKNKKIRNQELAVLLLKKEDPILLLTEKVKELEKQVAELKGIINRTIKYDFYAIWSEEDQEYVGKCKQFSSLSWLDEDAEKAIDGIKKLVELETK